MPTGATPQSGPPPAPRGAARAPTRAFLWCSALRWLPSGLFLPIFVLVLTERGLSLTQVGYISAVYGAVAALLELPTGGLADVLGRRPVLLVATVFDAALALGLLFGSGFASLLAAAALGGVGRALLSGPLESWYVDALRTADPGAPLRPGLSAAATVEALALGCGALLSALLPLLATSLPVTGTVPVEVTPALSLPLWGALVAQVLSFVSVALLVREPADVPRATGVAHGVGATIRAAVGLARGSADLRALMTWMFCTAVGLVAVEILWQPRFRDLLGGTEVATRVFGYLVVGMSLAAAAGSWLAGRLPGRRRSPTVTVVGATLAAGVALVGLALAGSFVPAVCAFFAVYLWQGCAEVGAREILHDHAPSATRSTVVSVRSLVSQSGNLAASLLLAPLADLAGISVTWLVGAGVVALGALAALGARPAVPSTDAPGPTVDGGTAAEIALHTPHPGTAGQEPHAEG